MIRQPQDAPEEVIAPNIAVGISKPEVWIIPHGSTERIRRIVEVVRSQEAEQAYMRIESAGKMLLDHHAQDGQGWGCLFLGVLLPRVEEGVFQEPDPTEKTLVAIKRLKRAAIYRELERGNHENPEREICRMQSIGDNHHVLGCIEALQDDRYLYIISPFCSHGTLENRMQTGPMLEIEARAIFSQVLQSLAYINHDHGICHRDISPGNALVHNNGRVVLNDLAMSFRIPPGGLCNPMGRFGKSGYWPPEIYMDIPFNAYACDLWAAVVTLFNLVTGEVMYNFPHPDDNLFKYCVMAQGVSRNPTNELCREAMNEVNNPSQKTAIKRIARKIRSLTPNLKLLFENSLSMNPDDRWTLEDIRNCEWMRLPNDALHL
jgi:serine/threonine protein kinase